MREAAKAALKALLRWLRRFVANNPRNDYEGIIFSGVRALAYRFGKV